MDGRKDGQTDHYRSPAERSPNKAIKTKTKNHINEIQRLDFLHLRGLSLVSSNMVTTTSLFSSGSDVSEFEPI